MLSIRHGYLLLSFVWDKMTDENIGCCKFELRLILNTVEMTAVRVYND